MPCDYYSPLQSLLKLISDCAVSALNPSRNDSGNESPLKIALFSLAKMCAHPLCRHFIRSSPLFPVIGRLQQSPESSIAKYASAIISKVAEPWHFISLLQSCATVFMTSTEVLLSFYIASWIVRTLYHCK